MLANSVAVTVDLPDLSPSQHFAIESRSREMAAQSFYDRDDDYCDWLAGEFCPQADSDYWLDMLRARNDDDARAAEDRLRDLYVSRCASRYWDKAYDEYFDLP